MATISDLMKLTGMGRRAVMKAIENHQLPAYRIGDKNIWVPDDALEDLRVGIWPRNQKREPLATPFLIQRTRR
jgi:hypothetical protein